MRPPQFGQRLFDDRRFVASGVLVSVAAAGELPEPLVLLD